MINSSKIKKKKQWNILIIKIHVFFFFFKDIIKMHKILEDLEANNLHNLYSICYTLSKLFKLREFIAH